MSLYNNYLIEEIHTTLKEHEYNTYLLRVENGCPIISWGTNSSIGDATESILNVRYTHL